MSNAKTNTPPPEPEPKPVSMSMQIIRICEGRDPIEVVGVLEVLLRTYRRELKAIG